MTNKSFGLQSIDEKMAQLLKPLFANDLSAKKKEFLLINNLVKNWDEVMGKKYTKFCYPKSISLNKSGGGGKLTIAVYNPSIGFLIESDIELILEKIARISGFKTINRIILKQEPKLIQSHLTIPNLPESKRDFVDSKLDGIDDKELRGVLFNMVSIINSKLKSSKIGNHE